MPPKPFPFAFRIGTDICSIARIQRIVDKDEGQYVRRWATKLFARPEWSQFTTKLDQYEGRIRSTRRPFSDIEDVDRPGTFAAWLAGRWAVKEATIKAHYNRKLVMRDISVLTDPSATTANFQKPSVIVDPPRKMVLMSRAVAKNRGVRIIGIHDNARNNDVLNSNLGSGGGTWARWKDPLGLREQPQQSGLRPPGEQEGQITRRHLVREEERQLVDASISHDTDYAVGVCIAAVGPGELNEPPVMDNGFGEPIHEPEWGDVGF